LFCSPGCSNAEAWVAFYIRLLEIEEESIKIEVLYRDGDRPNKRRRATSTLKASLALHYEYVPTVSTFEAAVYLQLAHNTVVDWIHDEKLDGIRVGGYWHVTKMSLEKYSVTISKQELDAIRGEKLSQPERKAGVRQS
jgi:excisionase family DNA binding protein